MISRQVGFAIPVWLIARQPEQDSPNLRLASTLCAEMIGPNSYVQVRNVDPIRSKVRDAGGLEPLLTALALQ